MNAFSLHADHTRSVACAGRRRSAASKVRSFGNRSLKTNQRSRRVSVNTQAHAHSSRWQSCTAPCAPESARYSSGPNVGANGDVAPAASGRRASRLPRLDQAPRAACMRHMARVDAAGVIIVHVVLHYTILWSMSASFRRGVGVCCCTLQLEHHSVLIASTVMQQTREPSAQSAGHELVHVKPCAVQLHVA